MTPNELLEILRQAALLKVNTRHCYTAAERKESVADHSWRVSLMAMLLTGVEEFEDVDMDRVIRMCLIHDLGESFTGDIPTFLKTGQNVSDEDAVFDRWVDGFPEPQRSEWRELLREMNAQQTPEARVYKALDKLEAIIAHNESDLATWLPLEYDLQYSYGREQCAPFPFLREVHDAIDAWTTEKIETEGKSS